MVRADAIRMVALLPQSCFHHPTRPGHALCMSCRQVVCQECASTWDGINYCKPCLAKRRAAPTGPSRWSRIAQACVLLMAWVALGALAAHFMAWSLAVVATWLS
jgi:hypothetical protein